MGRNVLIIVVGLLLLLAGCGGCGYNNLVKMDQMVNEKWANVESQYQRRSDLIPNLVKTVKGYANFEQETLTAVIDARSKATSVNINPGELTEANMAKFQEAQQQLGSSLGRLMVVVERYPDLKANQNFRDLQAELSGTENRIRFARDEYNKAVREYNTKVKGFPTLLYASIFGFDGRPFFEADAGTEKAPEVNFDDGK